MNQTISSRNYDRGRLRRWTCTLSNISARIKSLLHCLEQVAHDVVLFVNANKIEFLNFKCHSHLKWQLRKVSTSVYILQQQCIIYWKWCQHIPCEGMVHYYLNINDIEIWSTRKIMFFPSWECINTNLCVHHMEANERQGEKDRWKQQNKAKCYFEEISGGTLN